MRCCRVLMRGWWFDELELALVPLVDVLAVLAPSAPGVAERIKTRSASGAAPGPLRE